MQSEAWQFVAHSTAAWVFTFVLAILFPLLDWLVYNRAKSRMAIYAWNVTAEWSLTALCVWVAGRFGVTASSFGEHLGNPLRIAIVCAVLVVAIGAVVFFGRMQRKKASAAEISKAIANVRRMIPVTRIERMAFIVLALTAGICEELLYRGWLLNLFGAVLQSVWLGLLISSLLFGIAHIYQGRRGGSELESWDSPLEEYSSPAAVYSRGRFYMPSWT